MINIIKRLHNLQKEEGKNYTELGLFLRKIRRKNHETLHEMADKLNITLSYLACMEVGRREFTSTLCDKIIASYKLSYDEQFILCTYVKKAEEAI